METPNFNMTFEEMYTAIIENDESYDAVFFYAVKSTGIFCRPSCKSKTPKAENVEFFKSSDDANTAGYRACKRCRSDLLAYKPMREISEKLRFLIENSYKNAESLNSEMNNLGLSHKRMVEIFKDEYGVTPSSYVNELRHKEALRLLKESDREIIDIAYSVGFGSLSSFYKFFKERTNMSPTAYRKDVKK